MNSYRKVLLADPVLMNHSLLYYQAALASSGFEEAELTVATLVQNEADRGRLLELARSNKRLTPRILGVTKCDRVNRWESWREFGRAMRGIEGILRRESFDLVAYLYLDTALIYFALPVFRPALRAHLQARPAGLLLLDNGLRPPLANTLKARLRSASDRWLLGRVLRCGALRKVAFLDHWCTDRARALFGADICGYGVDPVFAQPCAGDAAREQLGLRPDDFVFLFFGTMSERKGVAESLAWLRKANLPKKRTAILIAGPSDSETRASLDHEIETTAKQYRVIRHDRFIQSTELPRYFAAADCVVCVYRGFTGSSNVLIQGAIYGKVALVSPGGAMEDAIRRHNFGEVVSLDDPQGFSAAAAKLASLSKSNRAALAGSARTYGRSMEAGRFLSQFVDGNAP